MGFQNKLDKDFSYREASAVINQMWELPLGDEEPKKIHTLSFTESEIHNYLIPAMQMYIMIKNEDYR